MVRIDAEERRIGLSIKTAADDIFESGDSSRPGDQGLRPGDEMVDMGDIFDTAIAEAGAAAAGGARTDDIFGPDEEPPAEPEKPAGT